MEVSFQSRKNACTDRSDVPVVPQIPHWPIYNATGGYGKAFHLNPDGPGPVPDTFRLAGTTFMNSVAVSQYGR